MHPKVFISYSWSSGQHEIRVKKLADRLISDGIDVIFDKYDLKPGNDKFYFMEKIHSDPSIDHVLVICDEEYTRKANARKGGAGNETSIYSPMIYNHPEQTKIIPIVCEFVNGYPCIPVLMENLIWFDLSSEVAIEENWNRLVSFIHQKQIYKKPMLGKVPSRIVHDETIYDVFNKTIPYNNKKIASPKPDELWRVVSVARLPERSVLFFWKSKVYIKQWCWSENTIKILSTENNFNSNVFSVYLKDPASQMFTFFKSPRPFYGGNIIPLPSEKGESFFLHDSLVVSRWFLEDLSPRYHIIRVFSVAADRHIVHQKAPIEFIDLSPQKVSSKKYPYPLFGDEYAASYSNKLDVLAYTSLQFLENKKIDRKIIFWKKEFNEVDMENNSLDSSGMSYIKNLEWSPSHSLLYIGTELAPRIYDFENKTLINIESEDNWSFYKSICAWHPTKAVFATPTYLQNEGRYYFRLELINEMGERIATNEKLHNRDIQCVHWSPSGQYIATGSLDCTVSIWDLTNDRVYTIQGNPDSELYKVEFSPDSQRLCVCGLNSLNSITVWDFLGTKKLATFQGYAKKNQNTIWHNESYRIAFEQDDQTLSMAELQFNN